MPSEDTQIFEFTQHQKCDKAPFVLYAYLKCLIEKIDGYNKNPENRITTKVGEHITTRFLVSTISSFKSIENIYDVYRSKDCMKKFCESLREHAMKITLERKNEVINKRPAGTIRNCKNLLYLYRKI